MEPQTEIHQEPADSTPAPRDTATTPLPSTEAENQTVKNLNLRLTLPNYERFHAFRRKVGLSKNEPTLVALLEIAEKNGQKPESAKPLDRLEQATARLAELVSLFSRSKIVKERCRRIQKPEEHPKVINPNVKWHKQDGEWVITQENSVHA